jgi:hypothetical protein
LATTKITTTTRLIANDINAVTVVATGITIGGNEIRRRIVPRETIEGSVAVTASARNVQRTMPRIRYSG